MRRLALTLLGLLAALALVPTAAAGTYPGANGRLVFFQEEIGGVDPVGLAVSDADGRNQTGDDFGPRCRGEGAQGSTLPCPVDPQWSPDGRLIAFGLGNAVATIRPDGSGLARLTFPHLYGITSPTWSPDGSRVAFSARHSLARGFRTIYQARLDGTGLRQVVSRGQADQPAWSSRNEIAFRRAGNIEVVNPDRYFAGARRVTSRGGSRPTWSPSGLTLAFVRSVARRRGSSRRVPVLFRVTGRGKKLKRLTRGRAEDPAWAPDGRGILFVRYADNNYFIHSVDPAGRRSRVVTGGFQGRRSAVTQPDQQPLPR